MAFNQSNSIQFFKKPFATVPISSVQFSRSVTSDSLQPCEPQHARPRCPSPTPRVHPKFMSIESVMPSSHIILCRPLLLLPPIPPIIRVFSNKSTLHTATDKSISQTLRSKVQGRDLQGVKAGTGRERGTPSTEGPKGVDTGNVQVLLIRFSSVTQLCPTLCDPMNRSTPGLPVHQQLLESTQTHVH